MARGGPRQGIAGRAYPQRKDLTLNPKAMPKATGQTYGQRSAQQQALESVPAPTPPSLKGPTAFPEEPVTAGASVGPGPGPEVLGVQGPQRSHALGPSQVAPAPFEAEIRELYAQFQNEDLRELIEDVFDEGVP